MHGSRRTSGNNNSMVVVSRRRSDWIDSNRINRLETNPIFKANAKLLRSVRQQSELNYFRRRTLRMTYRRERHQGSANKCNKESYETSLFKLTWYRATHLLNITNWFIIHYCNNLEYSDSCPKHQPWKNWLFPPLWTICGWCHDETKYVENTVTPTVGVTNGGDNLDERQEEWKER